MNDIANVADSKDKIEVTPAMIEAGAQAVSDNWYMLKDYADREAYRVVADDVYRRMQAERLRSPL